jgi:DUF177 domain-containing protein
MKNLKLPITIDPYKSAQRNLVCDGYFELSEFDRLSATAEKCSGQMNVKIQFGVDEQGLNTISGTGSTMVELTCQRCNELFEQTLSVSFNLSPIKKAEQADELPSYYDAIELDENGEVNLRELVESELLLAIPLIPRHELDDCQASADSTWGELPEELDKPNPFDVLKQLK